MAINHSIAEDTWVLHGSTEQSNDARRKLHSAEEPARLAWRRFAPAETCYGGNLLWWKLAMVETGHGGDLARYLLSAIDMT